MKTPREIADDCMVYSMGEVDEAPTLDRFESAILAERERWKAFADDKGEPRKVLGTLPVTADGCFAGYGADVSWYESEGHVCDGVVKYYIRTLSSAPTESWCPVHRSYSTRELAEAALAAAAKGVGK